MIGAALAGKELVIDDGVASEDYEEYLHMIDRNNMKNNLVSAGKGQPGDNGDDVDDNDEYYDVDDEGLSPTNDDDEIVTADGVGGVEAGKVSDLGSLTVLSDNGHDNYSHNSMDTEQLKHIAEIGNAAAMNNSLIVAATAGLSITLLCTVAAAAGVSAKLLENDLSVSRPTGIISSFSRTVLDSLQQVGGPSGALISLVAAQGILFLGQCGVALSIFRRTQSWRKL
jgi:hypothetical protein